MRSTSVVDCGGNLNLQLIHSILYPLKKSFLSPPRPSLYQLEVKRIGVAPFDYPSRWGWINPKFAVVPPPP